MALERSFRALGFYDVITNLVPGALWVGALIILLQVDQLIQGLPNGVIVGGFLALAYVTGHLLQALGSWTDSPTTFGDTLAAIQNETPATAPISITHVEESFLTLCEQRFSLPSDFDHHGKLLKMVLSYLATTSYTRALRFQALYSFHRSMWAASWSLLVVIAIFGLLSILGHVILPSLTVTGGITIAALVGVAVFWNRKNKFDKTFVNYLFIDFYNAQQSTVSENLTPGTEA
ncbi:hypothetical protein RH831_11030 [Halodesulfurarchaeum sp. HSR-GB]|uniref:hypothetical protein n=1 Tax=Halodesulfurarchaeum sp. HSR-GB TaxID=3074077 RepID=UPI0028547DFA|nr:hypothetical protein [Halodesulfurarchaeum sp. HSR-GB]MDR5657709.1 hypothetical protein [Halodesulfurarchaeum sp. HSR-GB]